ncbi:MAG: peptidylprolyl isomerase, partial [Pseudolabrys sp.]
VYGLEVGDSEITGAFENMAGRQHITVAQFTQVLERSGISPNTVKARIRAEMTWQQLIRGKYNSSLQIGDSDIAKALKDKNEGDAPAVGYIYTLYPVMVVVARGSSEATISAKRSEAENLRSRFASCADGLAMARGLRDVAVRDPITRNSADLSPQLRDLLGNIQVGRLTPPEVTAQGLQMFAVCNKKESATDSPQKREMREQLFVKRFESESKKYLDEIRKAAMIEYKNNK